MGDFSQSAKLVDAMGEDDEIPGCLEKRVDSVIGAEFELQAVTRRTRRSGSKRATKAPVPASAKLVEELEKYWFEWCPEEDLAEAWRWRRMLGAGLLTVDWTTGANRWTPRIRALPMHFCRFDETLSRYVYQAREGLQVVEPGNGKFILFEQGPRGWMRGSVRPMGLQWLGKNLCFRDWNRYNERHGLPIVKAKIPVVADNEDKDAFWDDIRELGSEVTAQLPQGLGVDEKLGFDLELLEAKDLSSGSFQKFLERADRKIQVHFLGGNLGTEVVDQGARSAAETHDSGLTGKACGDAQKLSTVLRTQFAWPVCALNYAAKQEDVPWPKWKTEGGADLVKLAAATEGFGKALAAVDTAGYEVSNVDELAEIYGLNLVRKEKPAIPAPPSEDPEKPEEGAEPEDPQDPKKPEEDESVTLSSGDSAAKARGFIEGHEFASRIADDYAGGAHALLADDLATVLKLIDDSKDYDELALRLRGAYSGMSLAKLAELTQKAIILSNLAGRATVLQDV